MGPIIICDECDFEGCTMTEILPDREKVSMGEAARRRQQEDDPSGIYRSTMRHCTRNFIIECPKCGHKHEFSKFTAPPQVMLAEAG